MNQKHRIEVSPDTLDLLWRARLVHAAETGRPIHTITHDEIVRQALRPCGAKFQALAGR